jgi:protocatechuate 3,4-dioxygenase alpha subunit
METTMTPMPAHRPDQPVSNDTASPRTPSQTIGPFSHEAWRWAVDATAPSQAQPQLVLHGVIFDGEGQPINDAMIEAWLPHAADAESALPMPGFRRVPSDEAGGFAFSVPMPGAGDAGQPLMYITVFARGLVRHQFTAVFLAYDPALAGVSMLEQVPAARRHTLIAEREADGRYRWDIRLQGAQETVFFDYC